MEAVLVLLGQLVALFGACSDTAAGISGCVSANIGGPLLDAAQFLIPAAVAVTGLNKLVDHRESAGTFFIEVATKAGGAFLLIQLVKAVSGLP